MFTFGPFKWCKVRYSWTCGLANWCLSTAEYVELVYNIFLCLSDYEVKKISFVRPQNKAGQTKFLRACEPRDDVLFLFAACTFCIWMCIVSSQHFLISLITLILFYC